MLPEGDILPDLPLRTLDLSAAHESSITSNDVFVDVCVMEPLDCRIRHTVVVRCWFYEAVSIFTLQVDPRYGDSIAIIPYYRIRKQKEDYQPLPCAVSQLASTEAHPRPQPPPPTVACCHDKSSLLSTPYKTHV